MLVPRRDRTFRVVACHLGERHGGSTLTVSGPLPEGVKVPLTAQPAAILDTLKGCEVTTTGNMLRVVRQDAHSEARALTAHVEDVITLSAALEGESEPPGPYR